MTPFHLPTEAPAFPIDRTYPGGERFSADGMTMRDYFAAKALQAFITARANTYSAGPEQFDEEVSRWSYETADAMLDARRKPRPAPAFNEVEQLVPLAYLRRLVDTMTAYVVPLHHGTEYPALEAAKAFLASLPNQAE